MILITCIFFVAPPLVPGESGEEQIRVLVTYGGHEFEEEAFWQMFDRLPGISYARAQLPADADLLKPGLERKFDAIVMYDMVTAFTAAQQRAFVNLLKNGIGLLSIHHNLGAHRDWPEFTRIIGGKYVFKKQILAGREHDLSTYAHDQDINVRILDRQHHITRGIENFRIHDETYGNYFTASDAKVLLSTDHPKSDHEIAWVTRYENSDVFYLLLGHDAKAWQNPVFPKLLLNAIRWSIGKNDGKRP